MNLRHLEHWLALADSGSFSRAAEKLHITQSALSRSIQALEEELGGALVDRIGKRNELTPLGRSVLERARRIVHEAAELKQGAAVLQQGGLGALQVGLGSGPGAMLMTAWLVHCARHHPGLRVSVSRGSTELQLQQLRERKLDALVVDVRPWCPRPTFRSGPFTRCRRGCCAALAIQCCVGGANAWPLRPCSTTPSPPYRCRTRSHAPWWRNMARLQILPD